MINIGLITTKQARRQPNAWAVFDNTSQRRVTFKELDDLVKKIANGLLSLGLKKGDRVSILSQNSIEFLALFFACGQETSPENTPRSRYWKLLSQYLH